MGKQVRRILIGLAVILVCLTGLLAVSTLVPNVGFDKKQGSEGRLMRNTHVQLSLPEQIKVGQSFSINGTLEMTDWNYPALWGDTAEPFPYQKIAVDSKLFHKEFITDTQGNFSGEFTVYNPGTFQVIASYAGDQLNNYRASSGYKVLEVIGQTPAAGNTDFSNPSRLPYLIVAMIIVVIITWEFLYRRFAMSRPSGKRVWVIPVWLSFVLVIVAVGSLVFALSPRQIPIDYPLNKSGTSPGPAMLAGLSLTVPNKFNAGDSLTFEGSLWQWGNDHETRTPLPHREINIVKDESEHLPTWVKSIVTDDEGNFAGKILIKKAGKYYITAWFRDSNGQPFDSNTEIVIVGNALLFSHWDSPGWLIVYGLLVVLLISGYRFIYLPRLQKENLGTILIFRGLTAALIVLELVSVISAFYPQEESPVFRIGEMGIYLPATHVTLEVPAKAEIRQPFIVKGTLTKFEDTGEIPLSGQEINIYLVETGTKSEQAELLTTISTDSSGSFSGETKVNSPGHYEISALFENTGGLYRQSGDTKIITVIDPTVIPVDHTGIPNRLPVIIISILVFLTVATAGYLLGRYGIKWPWYETLTPKTRKRFGFKRRNTKAVKVKTTTVPSVSSPPSTPISIHTPVLPVSIDFPQIPNSFPDVWGTDDSLLVVFTVNGTKQLLAQYSLDIELGPDSTTRTPISPDGCASQLHTFRKTGQYQIQAVLIKDVRNGYLPASRMVKIVDYREEIVRLYNEMIVSTKAQDLTLTPKMTAREVENRLRKVFPDLSGDVMDSLVSIFEEANYSLHPITRPDYEKMYLAVLEVQQYARK